MDDNQKGGPIRIFVIICIAVIALFLSFKGYNYYIAANGGNAATTNNKTAKLTNELATELGISVNQCEKIMDFSNKSPDRHPLESTDERIVYLVIPTISADRSNDNVIATAWFIHTATNRGLRRKALDGGVTTNTRILLIKEAFNKSTRSSALLECIYINDSLEITRMSEATKPSWSKISNNSHGEDHFDAVFDTLGE